MSALITGEWYMRNNHFPRWGRPFEFNAHLYKSIGRLEESRDSVSLQNPLCSNTIIQLQFSTRLPSDLELGTCHHRGK